MFSVNIYFLLKEAMKPHLLQMQTSFACLDNFHLIHSAVMFLLEAVLKPYPVWPLCT